MDYCNSQPHLGCFHGLAFVNQRPVGALRRHLKLKGIESGGELLDREALFNGLASELGLASPKLDVPLSCSRHDLDFSSGGVGRVSKQFLGLVVAYNGQASPSVPFVTSCHEKEATGDPLQALGSLELPAARAKRAGFRLSGELPIAYEVVTLFLKLRAGVAWLGHGLR